MPQSSMAGKPPLRPCKAQPSVMAPAFPAAARERQGAVMRPRSAGPYMQVTPSIGRMKSQVAACACACATLLCTSSTRHVVFVFCALHREALPTCLLTAGYTLIVSSFYLLVLSSPPSPSPSLSLCTCRADRERLIPKQRCPDSPPAASAGGERFRGSETFRANLLFANQAPHTSPSLRTEVSSPLWVLVMARTR